MHFSWSIIATAIVGATTVLATPFPKYTNCDLSQVALKPQWLVDPNNSSNTLPGPTSTQKLGKLLLGVGTQNYSCENGVPKANGAVAVLYDLSCAGYDPELADQITRMALHAPEDTSALGIRLFQTMSGNQFTVGVHFFKGDFATPAFEFNDPHAKFYGSVFGKIPCLAGSDRGKGEFALGAVPSLKLTERPGMGSSYSTVYRLHTAGGTAPTTCNWTGQKQIAYSAQYWFYKG